jgi:hypothetical protein
MKGIKPEDFRFYPQKLFDFAVIPCIPFIPVKRLMVSALGG